MKYFGAEGGIRTWLTEGKLAPDAPYITKEVGHHRKL